MSFEMTAGRHTDDTCVDITEKYEELPDINREVQRGTVWKACLSIAAVSLSCSACSSFTCLATLRPASKLVQDKLLQQGHMAPSCRPSFRGHAVAAAVAANVSIEVAISMQCSDHPAKSLSSCIALESDADVMHSCRDPQCVHKVGVHRLKDRGRAPKAE